jgi:GH35 family endo-1,4-beta-xylanase
MGMWSFQPPLPTLNSDVIPQAPTEPERNVFNYTDGDQIAELAEGSKMIFRGHNLVGC